MVEAILWDNDGVLVDTERLFFKSTRRILARIGIELSLEQFLELSMRQGRSAFRLAAESGWAEQEIADLKRERDLLYSEMLGRYTRVLPGVQETLKVLDGSMRMAVVTSSQRQHFDVMHAHIDLTRRLRRSVRSLRRMGPDGTRFAVHSRVPGHVHKGRFSAEVENSLLAQSVIRACDTLDGARDHIIANLRL